VRLLFAVVLAGCIASSSATCPDGRLCPGGTVCDSHDLCVLPDQLTACAGKQPADPCMFVGGSGHCLDGVCLPTTCGDGVVEFGEMCDPTDGTPCSADCMSNLKCGNGVIDVDKGETCDDSNFLDNDGCSSSCQIEQPHWIHHTLRPGPRNSVGITYDTRRKRAVGFGGNVDAITTNGIADTIEWNDVDWVFPPTRTSPPARTGAGVAYDMERGVTVMFGGFDSVFSMGDTWVWDGVDWHGVDVAGPPPRSSHNLVYDPKRKVTVMFGGYGVDVVGQGGDSADTWEWDGTMWKQINVPLPPKREAAQAAYDPKHGVIVVTGGQDSGANVHYTDTWTYDGTWHEVASSGSPQIAVGAMAWDPTSQKMLMFGGVNASGVGQSTVWAWDGTSWTSIGALPAGMGARSATSAVNTGTHIVLFGGQSEGPATSYDDTFIYANGSFTAPTAIGASAEAGVFNELGRDAIIVGGSSSTGVTGQTWELTSITNTLRAASPPTPRTNPCVTWDVVHHAGVLFGGTSPAGTALADTLVWNGAGWTAVTPAHVPPARGGAGCAFDGKHVTMMGGVNNVTALGDAWTWDGTDWTNVSVPAALVAREYPVAAFDPIANVMVLYGGQIVGGIDFVDTWTYDGTTWTPAAAGFKPNGREFPSLTLNPARGRLVLVGGIEQGTDSYEWDGTAWHTLAVGDQPPTRGKQEAMSSFDGGGVSIYGGVNATNALTTDGWELRWEASRPHEQCDGTDLDGDGLVGCADPDCWSICTPACAPGVPNCDPASGPTCGDGVCDPTRENARTCPKDCTAPAVCGDGYCDVGETGCPGDCP